MSKMRADFEPAQNLIPLLNLSVATQVYGVNDGTKNESRIVYEIIATDKTGSATYGDLQIWGSVDGGKSVPVQLGSLRIAAGQAPTASWPPAGAAPGHLITNLRLVPSRAMDVTVVTN